MSLALVGLLLAGTPVWAQGRAVELPEEVQSWMARDQAQRFAVMISQGETLFAEGSCVRCHRDDATGSARGPDLTDAEWVQSDGSLEGIRRTIFWGVKREEFADANRRFEMNPGGGMGLEFDQYAALASYVWSLTNETGLPGGRPDG